MRLRRLLIEHYGNFERVELALAAQPGCINLVVAPNGAGKSVLRQAFHDLLFGIPVQSKMRFRYDYAGMNLQADAVTQSGEDLSFGWKRKPGRVFGGDPGDAVESRFNSALGRVTPRQLEHLFALDTDRLRAGGEELAAGGDSLGLALLSGTGELASAKAVRMALAERRDAIWEKGKSARPLAKAGKAVEQARKDVRGAVQLPAQRAREEQALAEQRALLEEARATHLATQARTRRLARIDRTRRFLHERAAAEAWLAANPDAPALAVSLVDDLAAARQALSLTQARLAGAKQAAAAAQDAAAAITLDPAALEHADALGRLPVSDTETKAHDMLAREAERREALVSVTAALRDLGAALPVEQAATLLPLLSDVAAARQRISQHAARLAACETADQRLRQATQDLARLDAEATGPAPSVDDLRALLQTIRADRDPARHAAGAAQAERNAAAAEAAALATLPGWHGTAADLRTLAPPPESAFQRLDAARATEASVLREKEGARDRMAADRTGWTRLLESLQARPLPDEAAITQARVLRDRGWQLIYRHAFTPHPPQAAEERAYTGDEPLPLVFERHLRAADDLADQRLAELARVEEAERLRRELERTADAWQVLLAAVQTARDGLDAASRAWSAAVAPLGLDADATMADVRHFLTARGTAVAAGIAADLARSELAAIQAAHAEWAGQLRALLSAEQPFATLLATADARLKAADAAAAAQIRHQAERSTALRAQQAARAEKTAAEAAMTVWRQDWAACLTALGRPADETPAVTEAILQRLVDLERAHTKAADLAGRIAGMQADIDRFERSVADLAGRLVMTLQDGAVAAARRMFARRDVARTWQTRWEAAQATLEKARANLALAEATERGAQQGLDGIVAACGAANDEEAERRIAASRDRIRHETMRRDAEAGLLEHGEGLPLATLMADAESVPAEQMAAERATAEQALDVARAQGEAAAAAVSQMERRLADAAGTGEANEAMLTQAAAAAHFSQLLDDYLVLTVATDMLGRAVTRVEEGAGGAGLRRIASAFERVTNDCYTIEGGEGSGGETILLAVERRWPTERKVLAQLSEGTRDQLYLALRMVALEDHAAHAPPLPFIADDILQTFDDSRALAALHALLAMSRHTQVIILTHHQHLAALATALPVGSVHLQAL
jgi:uncharacterized protein YhaN